MPESINPTKSARSQVVAICSDKQCRKCGEAKPASFFHKHSKTKDKLSPYCKSCANARASQHYKSNPFRRWCFNVKRLYGITAIQYFMILDQQGGKCAVCGGDEIDSKRNDRMPVDHCHETGRVRGILCTSCNRAIGLMKDNAAIMRKAATYLENYL